jgi:hypothetical protein
VKKNVLGWSCFAGWMILSASGCLGSPEDFEAAGEDGVAVSEEELTSRVDGSFTHTWDIASTGGPWGTVDYIQLLPLPLHPLPNEFGRYHHLMDQRGFDFGVSTQGESGSYDAPSFPLTVVRSAVLRCVQGSTTTDVRRSGWFTIAPNQVRSVRWNCPGTARMTRLTVTVRQEHAE